MRFAQLTKEIFCKPCLITPQMHQQISRLFFQHVTGEAHQPGGALDLFRAGPVGSVDPAGSVMSIFGDVAVIHIDGVITRRAPAMMKEMCGMKDLDDIEQALKDAEASPRLRGILLYIDSPGGSVTGVPEVANRIADCQKPVVAFTDSMCDSAAYWLAAGADEIVASQSASVGSIGVYMAYLDQRRAYELAGFETQLFKTGDFKGMGIPGTSLTEDQKLLLQDEVDKIFGWFTGHVTAHRNVSGPDTFQGQEFGAADALTRGLIDMVGSFDEAMQELRTLMD